MTAGAASGWSRDLTISRIPLVAITVESRAWKDWNSTHKTSSLITAGRLRANNDDLCLRVDRVDYHFTRYLVDVRVAVCFLLLNLV